MLLLLLVAMASPALLMTGCSQAPKSTSTSTTSPGFSGTRFSTYQDGSEKLILNADGSYKQFIQTKNHRTLTNISRWTPSQGPANSSNPGPWFIIHDYVTPWDWVKSKPNDPVKRSNLLISTEGFKGIASAPAIVNPAVTTQKAKIPDNLYATFVLVGVLFTIVWVGVIVAAATRGQIGWLIFIVLFPCLATPIYGVMLMISPNSNRRY